MLMGPSLGEELINLDPWINVTYEPDRAHLERLARIGQFAGPEALQTALDFATSYPITARKAIAGEIEASADLTPDVAGAFEPVLDVVRSNIVYRIHDALTPDTEAVIQNDGLQVHRRHIMQVSPGDKDRFRQWGSTLLWDIAQLSTGRPVRRDVRYNRPQYGV
jgi:hypothetical protein